MNGSEFWSGARADSDFLDEPLISYRQHGGNQVGVRRRTTTERLSTLLTPGGQRNERLLRQWQELTARLENIPGVSERYRRTAANRLAHERFRSGSADRRRNLCGAFSRSTTGTHGLSTTLPQHSLRSKHDAG